MSNNEELIMNLDLSRMQHDLWKSSVQKMFDYEGHDKVKSEIDGLIDLYRNFDKKGFDQHEIKEILTKKRQKQLEELEKQ